MSSTREYTAQEKESILRDLDITPLNGMISSSQVAQIMSIRAKIETGIEHIYTNDAVRRRVKSGTLKIAMSVNDRMNLFNVDDVFSLDLEPQKWHTNRRGKQ